MHIHLSEPYLPRSIEELLFRIDHHWSELVQFILGLSEEQFTSAQPYAWNIKDNLAHLEFWEQFLLRHHLQGISPSQFFDLPIDQLRSMHEDSLNAIIWERTRQLPLPVVLDKLHKTHCEVVVAIQNVSYPTLLQPDAVKTLIDRPVLESVVCNTYEHYQEHLKTMRILCSHP